MHANPCSVLRFVEKFSNFESKRGLGSGPTHKVNEKLKLLVMHLFLERQYCENYYNLLNIPLLQF